ncbi:Dehydrogenase, E1 component [Artemisia annua]|uniref:Dehydrogenase, E1 component n=1 Tax=Artemisia annua TaxID=35608 RepID=A0A2U1LEQ4_ARTAN|nr:Dehydrogenase, E1 component [Artemisia annua]
MRSVTIKVKLAQAIENAEQEDKTPVADIFNDVDDVPLKNLKEQETSLTKIVKKHTQECPSNIPV